MHFEYSYTVTAGDIDELGHAGNYHYVRWMQLAAIAHSTAIGWSSLAYKELGAGWVVRSHQITYLQPAFERDKLIIKTWVANLKPATSLRRYRITRDDDTIATAETDWAFIDHTRGKPIRLPAAVRTSFEAVVINDTAVR
ncbi:MAG: acyl-CoA thioesterase [Xanthomonadales bacterium]|nr:acyl-CoA thioesterase [Xanthomonadales bacterium]